MKGKKGRTACLLIVVSLFVLSLSCYGEAIDYSGTDADVGFETFVSTLSDALNERNAQMKNSLSETAENPDIGEICQICRDAAMNEWKQLKLFEEIQYGEATSVQEVIREGYLSGLKLQAECNTEVESEFWAQWELGYELRAYAVMELVDIYGATTTIDETILDQMRTYTGAPCDNYSDEAFFIQGLLAAETTPEGAPYLNSVDGELGSGTKSSLRRFLVAQGIKPVSGLVNQNLISRLIREGVVDESLFADILMNLGNNEQILNGDFTYQSFLDILSETELESETGQM